MIGKKCVQCDDGNTETCKKGCSEIKLFGVQISVPPSEEGGAAECSSLRKCKSMDNLEACAAVAAAEEPSGYLSDGFVHQYSKSHDRKRGKPWSEEEHRSFLEGLEKLGKGDWKGIASKFVPSRKSSQVASHAQKYFNRLNLTAANKRRRRASVFDISPTHHANQPSQGSQSNNIAEENFHIASSSPAASKNIGEQKLPPHTPTSVRPPLSPVQSSWSPDFHGVIYLQPRVAGFTKGYPTQAGMPRLPWPQVVYLPSQSAPFVPNNFSTSRQGWFQAASLPSTTNNEELNLNIRNLTL